jgi:hypothetical protein
MIFGSVQCICSKNRIYGNIFKFTTKERCVQNNEGRLLEVYDVLEYTFRTLEIVLCTYIIQNLSLSMSLYIKNTG